MIWENQRNGTFRVFFLGFLGINAEYPEVLPESALAFSFRRETLLKGDPDSGELWPRASPPILVWSSAFDGTRPSAGEPQGTASDPYLKVPREKHYQDLLLDYAYAQSQEQRDEIRDALWERFGEKRSVFVMDMSGFSPAHAQFKRENMAAATWAIDIYGDRACLPTIFSHAQGVSLT